MKKLILLAAAIMAISAMAFASTASASSWAHCKNFKCVNKKLNKLHKADKAQNAKIKTLVAQVAALEDTNIPSGNALQGEIVDLQNTDSDQYSTIYQYYNYAINYTQSQPAVKCWNGTLPVTRYHGSYSGTEGAPYTDNSVPAYIPAFDGYLDVHHSGQPDTAVNYNLGLFSNNC